MQIQPFELERYFARYEFSAPYLLSPSDIEPLTMSALLAMATEKRRQQWDNLWLGYTESQGHPDLLQAISEHYQRLSPQNVIEVVPEEGIFIAMNTLLDDGDHVIVMHPAYQSLSEIAKSRGISVSNWKAYEQWHFELDSLESLLEDNTHMLVVNTPHNPTGIHFSATEWDSLLAFAEKHDLWFFSDEMYRYSEHEDNLRLDAACDRYEKAVSLSGMSKSFALPGLRVGWLATQNAEAMQRFITFKDYTTICGSAPSELLALIALEAREQILERNLAIIAHNLTVLDQFFVDYSDHFRWQRPHAGTVALVEYLGDEPIQTLADQLVAKKGLMIVPASVFQMDGDYFRLGFGRRNLPEALQQLADFMDERS